MAVPARHPEPLRRGSNDSVARTFEVRTVVIPSIPLVEARSQFLDGLRWKTSRLSGRRLTAGTAEKYSYWLKRFERWLVANGLPLDLGALTEEEIRQFQECALDEIDDGTLQESSAATYVRCVKTLFADTWKRLQVEPAANPTLRLSAGSQGAVDFPLFKTEHVRALLQAAIRTRPPHVPEWVAYRDHALLACFFDLGWRVGEASKAVLDDVDLRTGYVTLRCSERAFRGRQFCVQPNIREDYVEHVLASGPAQGRESVTRQFREPCIVPCAACRSQTILISTSTTTPRRSRRSRLR